MRNVTIAGNEYPISYTINSLVNFEGLTGKSAFDDNAYQTATGLRALFYCGLVDGGRKMGRAFQHDIIWVGENVNVNPETTAIFLQEFTSSMGRGGEDTKGGKPQPGTT